MKKVARLRVSAIDHHHEFISTQGPSLSQPDQMAVRTTGRIKKPKAVFDPSDNYLPKSLRPNTGVPSTALVPYGSPLEREKSSTNLQKCPPVIATTSPKNVVLPMEKNFYCYVCNKGEAKRGANAKNKLINCHGCKRRAHKLCLKMDFGDLETLIKNYRCENCLICEICRLTPNGDKCIITCSRCVKSFHYGCHKPNILKFQQGDMNWKCSACTPPPIAVRLRKGIDNDQIKYEIIDNEKEPTPTSFSTTGNAGNNKRKSKAINGHENRPYAICSEPNNSTSKKRKSETIYDNDDNERLASYNPMDSIGIPTGVKNWTVDEVVTFFSKYFPKEAKAFREHEIDGISLLLMKRSDVIKKLPFKLGPSLRIYNLILKMQKEVNDPTLGWDI